jgi:phage terminase large subunit GpA-like protein
MKSNPKAINAFFDSLADAAAQALRPLPRMTVPDWADTYRRLSSATSAIGGPWRTSRVEIGRGPMMAVTEPGVQIITAMTCTQLLKTSLLENVIGYYAHLDPCPMLLVQPKEDAVRKFVKERLAPMARESAVLTPILSGDRERGGEATLNYKPFNGGFLALESAGSPTNLAMRAIRVTLLDEIDKYEVSPKEGDPLPLAEERSATFQGRGRLNLRACSPTWTEESRIFKSYTDSDQRRAFVACPHCKFEQALHFFKHVQWAKDSDGNHLTNTAQIVCENCGQPWSEAERMRLITTKGAIKWRQTKPFTCCGVRQEPLIERRWKWDRVNDVGRAVCKECGDRTVTNHHAGFTASKLFSPFITVAELAAMWIAAKNDNETKQTFYNTQLGEPFELQVAKAIEGSGLMDRREEYPPAGATWRVPKEVVRLTCGVDVQPSSNAKEGRLEYEIVGWGRGEESWSIEFDVLQGDPSNHGPGGVWDQLDQILKRALEHERGGRMVISATCIDSGGHNTQDVYQFCRSRLARNVWAIKGASDKSGQWSPVWPIPKQERGKIKQTGFRPVILGVNAAKEAIRQKLFTTERGPGFTHFNMEWNAGQFAQLTSEKLVLEKKAGITIKSWQLKPGHANEALDRRVYAYAALQGLKAVRKLNLERAADALEGIIPPDDPTPAGGASAPKPKKPVDYSVSDPHVRRSNWNS